MIQSEQGLTNTEVKDRQLEFGLNRLPETPPPSFFVLILNQLKSPLIYILLIASLITLIIGHLPDALIIFLAVLVNTVLGFIQEKKASHALRALKAYVISKVTVIRNNTRILIEISQIVPGDIVILNQGTKVPADGVLISTNRLYLDEAILTGESNTVNKTTGDPIYMGTTIASGQASMKVSTIGARTKIGEIALEIQEVEGDTPLQKQLKTFSKQLLIIIIILLFIVFFVGLLYRFSLIDMFTISVALAVSSIPEGLLVSLTVVLAIGMQRILKRRGLVKKLSAAETLGGVTVICIDKTGTLTQGMMEVTDIVGNKKDLAEQILLANDLDDPLLISAFEWGKSVSDISNSKYIKLDSIPFSSQEKFFVSLHRWSNNHNRLFVNGAPELLLKWSNLSNSEKVKIISTIDSLTKQGKRIIGLAHKDMSLNQQKISLQDAKTDLVWGGLIAFSDPVREGVKEALKEATAAGVRTMVITGDYAKTSEFVLSELGISLSSEEIMLGDELSALSSEDLLHRVNSIKLFARTTPDQKLRIVQALKENGEVVAMMGDGVNDAPALHNADIGIVVSEATDVARESADLILLDSNFATIIGAIEEGRAMFNNIRKIILYLMCDAFVEIFIVILSIILKLPLPITAIQILWINLISDGLPNLALTLDPKNKNIMREKPRRQNDRLITKWMLSLIIFVSLTAGLIALTAFIVVYNTTHDLTLAQSVTFLIVGINSLAYVFSIRTLLVPSWKSDVFENKWLTFAVVIGLGLQILPFTPPLRSFFGVSYLEPIHWLVAIGSSLSLFFVVEVFKYFYPKKIPRLARD